MESTNFTTNENMTNTNNWNSSGMEFIGGIACFALGVALLSSTLIILICVFIRRRKNQRKEEQKKKRSMDLKDYHGKGNYGFEYDESSFYEGHVGLPLPTRPDTPLPSYIFSLTSSNVTINYNHAGQNNPTIDILQTSVTRVKNSKRQDSNSSSDCEIGAVSLHRTSPLAAIYLIYDELNKPQTRSSEDKAEVDETSEGLRNS